MNKFYVYVAFRPNGIPCYVGKGSGDRWKIHFTRCSNPHLNNIIKRANNNLPIVIIKDGLNEQEAFEIEKAFIAALGRETDGGPLVNLTTGGEGSSGRVETLEMRARRSLLRRSLGKEWQKRNNAARKRALTAEVRKRIGDAQRGRKRSDEFKAKISAATKGRKLSKAHIEATRRGNLGKKRSEETRLKQSLSRLSWFAKHGGYKRKSLSAATKKRISDKLKDFNMKRKSNG